MPNFLGADIPKDMGGGEAKGLMIKDMEHKKENCHRGF